MNCLEENRNYIVSGLERSGTSMMMQILKAGKIPIAFDESRKPDSNNPKGYYELEGGKVINKLQHGKFNFDKYLGKFIKVTSYGTLYFPGRRNYTVIYMERDIQEILDSSDTMIGEKDKNRSRTIKSLEKLNRSAISNMMDRIDTRLLLMNYNNILDDPEGNIDMILEFLELPDDNLQSMIKTVDDKLYRNRR